MQKTLRNYTKIYCVKLPNTIYIVFENILIKELYIMREPERIERILELIKQIWIKQPDSRFLQMISNIEWRYSAANNDAGKEYSYSKWETPRGDVIFNKDVTSVDLFHLEDDKLELFLQDYLNKLGGLNSDIIL
jgi:hypothetical protein